MNKHQEGMTMTNCIRRSNRSGPAFTLIELLVVVAVIAILMSVLLPALGAARGVAQKIGGASIQRQLNIAQQDYASHNDYKYAGPNTSGLVHQGFNFNNGFSYNYEGLLGYSTGSDPVSTYDWISPSIGLSMQFSANRAERHADIFNDLACPAATRKNDTVYNNDFDDANDFDRVLLREGFTQISFLSPVYFHLFPTDVVDQDLIRHPWARLPDGRPVAVGIGESENWRTVDQAPDFRPRLDRIRQPSAKILIADGNRYYTDDDILDFDANPAPGSFGSFTTSGPIFDGSTSYGRNGSGGAAAADGRQLSLSVRHDGGNAINTSRFDGSSATMTTDEMYSDPRPWYPSGTIWRGGSATEEAKAFMSDQEFVQ
jgi:prepilin-type N-terminal cleavage/methylation domain-containing protein